MARKTHFILYALQFAILTTIALILLLIFDVSWKSSVLIAGALSVILVIGNSLRLPLHAYNNTTFYISATLSILVGYWLLINCLINYAYGIYQPAIFAFGAILIGVPTIGGFFYYDEFVEQRRGRNVPVNNIPTVISSEDQFKKPNVNINIKEETEHVGSREIQQPKPQVVSVVWYWKWFNPLIFALGLVPAIVFGLIYLVEYGVEAVFEGIAIGSMLTMLPLIYVVWNR